MISPIAANFGTRVNEYVVGRPEYPEQILSDLPPSDVIVDLGAGTGKFTRALSRLGTRVVAIEPIADMAARIPIDRLAGVDVLVGRAEAIPLRDASAGLICCATAFHWFDYDQATGEILRVLTGRGSLALIWNIRDDHVPWVAALSRLLDRYAGDAPRQSSRRWRAVFADRRFAPMAAKTYSFGHRMPVSGLVDRVLSTSFIAALPAERQKTVQREVADIIAQDCALSRRGEIEFPYRTELYLFDKRTR